MNERWHVQGGLRFERTSARNESKIGPRFSARFNVTEDVTLKAATGMYYQFLNLVSAGEISFFDMWAPLDNKLPPGKSIDYVFGTETHPSEGYDFNVDLYYKTLDNLVEFKNEVTRTTELNKLFYVGK